MYCTRALEIAEKGAHGTRKALPLAENSPTTGSEIRYTNAPGLVVAVIQVLLRYWYSGVYVGDRTDRAIKCMPIHTSYDPCLSDHPRTPPSSTNYR